MSIHSAAQMFADPAFPLKVLDMCNRAARPLHGHAYTEVLMVLSGSAMHFTQTHEHAIRPGDVIVINGQEQHGYRNASSLHLLGVFFCAEQLQLGLEDLGDLPGFHALFTLEPWLRRREGMRSRVRLGAGALREACDVLETIQKALRGTRPGYKFECRALLMRFIALLVHAYGHPQQPAPHGMERLASVIGHIEQNLEQQLSLAELARRAHMSERNLQRTFHDAFAMTPLQYQWQQRMERAKTLLRETDLPVTDVARRIGVEDPNYFSRQFRRHQGVTPLAFRREAGRG